MIHIKTVAVPAAKGDEMSTSEVEEDISLISLLQQMPERSQTSRWAWRLAFMAHVNAGLILKNPGELMEAARLIRERADELWKIYGADSILDLYGMSNVLIERYLASSGKRSFSECD